MKGKETAAYLVSVGVPDLMDSLLRLVLRKRPPDHLSALQVICDECSTRLTSGGAPRPSIDATGSNGTLVSTPAKKDVALSPPIFSSGVPTLQPAPHTLAVGARRKSATLPPPCMIPTALPDTGAEKLGAAVKSLKQWLDQGDESPPVNPRVMNTAMVPPALLQKAQEQGLTPVPPSRSLGNFSGSFRSALSQVVDFADIMIPQVSGSRADLQTPGGTEAPQRGRTPKFYETPQSVPAADATSCNSPFGLRRVGSQPSEQDSPSAQQQPLQPLRRRSRTGSLSGSRLLTKAPRRGRSKSGIAAEKKKELSWKRGTLLGRGAFGTVHTGLNTQTGELMAVKTIEFNPQDKEIKKKLTALQNEISLMKNLNHPSIVRYLCSEREKNSFNIFMEYVPGGSIQDLLKQFGALTQDAACYYAREILVGLVYLHGMHVIHRDIKGANILLTVDGECKLADFGCSGKISHIQPRRNSLQGTPLWMAPEVIMQQEYDNSVDIWSTGCTVLEMITADAPFQYLGRTQVMLLQFICNEDEPIDTGTPEMEAETKNFISICLQRNPAKRPTAEALLHDEWITALDDECDLLSPGSAGGPGEHGFSMAVGFQSPSMRRISRAAPHSPRGRARGSACVGAAQSPGPAGSGIFSPHGPRPSGMYRNPPRPSVRSDSPSRCGASTPGRSQQSPTGDVPPSRSGTSPSQVVAARCILSCTAFGLLRTYYHLWHLTSAGGGGGGGQRRLRSPLVVPGDAMCEPPVAVMPLQLSQCGSGLQASETGMSDGGQSPSPSVQSGGHNRLLQSPDRRLRTVTSFVSRSASGVAVDYNSYLIGRASAQQWAVGEGGTEKKSMVVDDVLDEDAVDDDDEAVVSPPGDDLDGRGETDPGGPGDSSPDSQRLMPPVCDPSLPSPGFCGPRAVTKKPQAHGEDA